MARYRALLGKDYNISGEFRADNPETLLDQFITSSEQAVKMFEKKESARNQQSNLIAQLETENDF